MSAGHTVLRTNYGRWKFRAPSHTFGARCINSVAWQGNLYHHFAALSRFTPMATRYRRFAEVLPLLLSCRLKTARPRAWTGAPHFTARQGLVPPKCQGHFTDTWATGFTGTSCSSRRYGARLASPYMVDMVEAKPTRRLPSWCCEANNTTIHLAILVTHTCIYRLFIYIWLASPDIIIYTKPATPTPRPARALLLPGPSLNANHSSVERVYRARIPFPC